MRTYMSTYMRTLHTYISMSDLADMYPQSPRVPGPRVEGIHIRQITCAYVKTNNYVPCASSEPKSAQARLKISFYL